MSDIPALATAPAPRGAGARSRQNGFARPQGRSVTPALRAGFTAVRRRLCRILPWGGSVLAACWGERRKPQTHQPKEESETCAPTTLPSTRSASDPSRPRSGRTRPGTPSATTSPSVGFTVPTTASGRPPGASARAICSCSASWPTKSTHASTNSANNPRRTTPSGVSTAGGGFGRRRLRSQLDAQGPRSHTCR